MKNKNFLKVLKRKPFKVSEVIADTKTICRILMVNEKIIYRLDGGAKLAMGISIEQLS